MSISIASRKAKGREFQKWVANQISEFIWKAYKKMIYSGYEDDKLIQPRLMSQGGDDIILRDEAAEYFPYNIECKRVEKFNINQAIAQAKKYQQKGKDWIVFWKKSNQQPVIIMDAEAFFRTLERMKDDKEK